MACLDTHRISTSGLAALMLLSVAATGCPDDGMAEGSGSSGTAPTASTSSTSSPTPEPTGAGSGTVDSDSSSVADSGSSDDTTTAAESCESFELAGDMFYPEGIAFDAQGMLYVASLAGGSVIQTEPCGEASELIAAGGELRNPVGMIVDDAGGRLVVCDSDITFTDPPSIDVFELSSGTLLGSHAFDAVGFCNDVTFDAEGNLYATDSGGGRVLRVAAADLEGNSPAETWATDPDFAVDPGQFGLNGIDFDGAGNLYVNNFQQGELHRIAIEGDGSPGAITPITVDGGGLMSPDGMKWMGDGTLLVVQGGLSALTRVTLDGDTASSEVLADGLDFPTTVAPLDGEAWVPEGQLDHLFGFDEAPVEPPFVVTRVPL